MTRLLAVVLLTALGLCAQETKKTVELKNLRGTRLEAAAKLINTFLHPGNAVAYPEFNTIVMHGSAQDLTAAEALVARLDVPSTGTDTRPVAQSYQLKVYIVEALLEPAAPTAVPPEIASAVEQMRRSFVYKSYHLLDTVLLNTNPGSRPSLSGLLSGPGQADSTYGLEIRELRPIEDGKALYLGNFTFRLRFSKNGQFSDIAIQTDLTIRLGQKLVVGKLSTGQNANNLFLILTAEPA